MNTIRINLKCPACSKEVTLTKVTDTVYLEGICPECKTTLRWDREDMILMSFKPEGAIETGPTCEVKIDPTWEEP